MTFAQADFDIRCEWGLQGVTQLAPISDMVIIVDVFSFTTCVEIATQPGRALFIPIVVKTLPDLPNRLVRSWRRNGAGRAIRFRPIPC
ncbi:MAG: hypothetical protein R3E79_20980 [Caldilineaceae bacterium]